MKKKTLIYVNFAPYENSGRIRDYILENFSCALVFTFNFHQLTKTQNLSNLTVYREGKSVYSCVLRQLPVSESLVFTMLPVRSFMISGQIIYHLVRLRNTYGKYDIFFTVNAFTAYIGNWLRTFGLIKKTIVWVWDYYPPKHPNLIITFMRFIYWQFDKQITNCDRVVFLNKRIETLRKEIGILPKRANYPVVPIGTDTINTTRKKKSKIILGFVGVVKKSQGLDLLFDEEKILSQKKLKVTAQIVGGGPELIYFKNRGKKSKIENNFHGYIESEEMIKKILTTCTIGLAPYIPEESNVSYYADPSKIKTYLSLGLPVITTNVFKFSEEIEQAKAGIVIPYGVPGELTKAIEKINKDYEKYSKNALSLSRKYDYKKIYKTLFEV